VWKSPVENSVENVEKCEFSTGISMPAGYPHPNGKLNFLTDFVRREGNEIFDYVTGVMAPDLVELSRKSCQCRQNTRITPGDKGKPAKKFVKNTQILQRYHFPQNGKNSPTTNSGGHVCRGK